MEEGLNSITGKTHELLALKDTITIYVKYLEWKEYRTPWSQGGVQCSFYYLKTHLLKTLLDPHFPVITITSTDIKLPMIKGLPTLREVADDFKVKDEFSIQERDVLIVIAQDRRKNLAESGLIEGMKLINPSCAPPVSVGLVIQMLYFYEDEDARCTTCGWST